MLWNIGTEILFRMEWQEHDNDTEVGEERSVIGIDVSVYLGEVLKKFSGLKSVVRIIPSSCGMESKVRSTGMT